MSEYDDQMLHKFGVAWHAERQRIDASTVTLAIQDPCLGTVRSLQSAGTWGRCEYIDGIPALPQDVIGQCVAIDGSLRRRGWKR